MYMVSLVSAGDRSVAACKIAVHRSRRTRLSHCAIPSMGVYALLS
jgi:hypothetical protein